MLVSLFAWPASAVQCANPVSVERIEGLLDRAESAFVELHIETFLAMTDQMRLELPCLGEVPPRALVARIHRSEGLRMFGERNVDAVRAFAAARALDADFAFPEEMVPPDSPILADWSAMDLEAVRTELLPEPLAGTLYVDGQATLSLPRSWPSLVQLVSPDAEAPAFTVYLRHDAALPFYAEKPTERRRGRRVPLIIATGAAVATAAGSYGGAWWTRSIWSNPTTEEERLSGLRTTTNALTGASLVAGLTSVASGTLLVMTW